MTEVDETMPSTVEAAATGQESVDRAQGYDPAQQSLSDALRVSFLILKLVMVIAVIFYLFSGIFEVNEQQKALRLRFGKIVGQPGKQVYGPGWHFGLPYPIEQKLWVPTSPRTVSITNVYWYSTTQRHPGPNNQPLNPLKDGSLLTGDANIVHARFQVGYKITDPVAFERHVTELSHADKLVKAAAEQSIVAAVAQVTADSLIRGNANQTLAQKYLQAKLDSMDSGLTVDYVALSDQTMPQAVHNAYQAVINAENQQAQEINKAKQQRTKILGGAAGRAGLPQANGKPGPLVALMDQYEFASQAGDQTKAAALKRRIDVALRTLSITDSQGHEMPIGGQVASIINQAKSYGDEVQQKILSERNNFVALYQQYKTNPRILADRLWENAREQIFTGNVETFYAMPGQTYIVINRSPAVERKLQQQAMKAAASSAKQSAGSSSGGGGGGE